MPPVETLAPQMRCDYLIATNNATRVATDLAPKHRAMWEQIDNQKALSANTKSCSFSLNQWSRSDRQLLPRPWVRLVVVEEVL